MRLTARPFVPDDATVVCAFPQTADELFFMFPRANFPLTPEQLLATVAERSDATVIELDGAVVGFANFFRWQHGGRCAIGNVIVSPAHRGCGIGRFLIEQMIRLAREGHQASEITISCFNENTSGLLFYPKLGFVPYAVEERQNQRGDRVALIHMRLSKIAP